MEVGKTRVRVIDEFGNKCAVGIYCGQGIPAVSIGATYPSLIHFAISVQGQMRYYPTGFHTLQLAREDD
jgi:hypothetical protein